MNLLFAHPALSFSFARSVARPLFALLLMCCWLPITQAQTNATQTTQEARPLELGKPIERELAGGQQHSYQITLTAGQYLNVIVEQRGIDVAVVLIGPDGKQVFEVNNELRIIGPASFNRENGRT